MNAQAVLAQIRVDNSRTRSDKAQARENLCAAVDRLSCASEALLLRIPPPEILLVEDDANVARAMARILERETEAHLTCASSGEEALILVMGAQAHYDLLIVDLLLPQMHGLQFIELIRTRSRWPRIPIIATSGEIEPQAAARAAFNAGASSFYAKPVTMCVLTDDIYKLLQLPRRKG